MTAADCVFTGTKEIRMRHTFDLNGNTLTIGDGSTESGMTLIAGFLSFRDSVGGGKIVSCFLKSLKNSPDGRLCAAAS